MEKQGFVKRQFGRLFLLVMILILILLSLSLVYGRFQVNIPGRAAVSGQISLSNSYIFASPLSACSDGASLIRVTVFVIDDRGLGVANQTVALNAPGGLTVSTVQGVTDNIGKGYFDVASFNPGTYSIEAEVEGKSIPQTVNVGFRDDAACGI